LLAKENFSFAKQNILLQIVSSRFRHAKIFHGFGHCNPVFLAKPEKMVDSISAGKNHSSVIKNVDSAFPEFNCMNRLQIYEWPEFNLEIILFCKIEIR
jgi:hypothetical protein